MIYFDNAATTMLKPPEVAQAVAAAINSFGGVGRATHDAALGADMTVYRARRQVAKLFGAPDPKRVVFTHNVTEALNIIITGLVGSGDHAVTTAASHNSVLRPLFRATDKLGAQASVLAVDTQARIDYEEFDSLFRSNTRLAIVTHASNLTGDVYDIARMASITHAHGALFAVDAAQSAGVIDIDMVRDSLDIVAFTGHKSLYGPQGTGGLVLAPHVDLPSYNEGGTGTHSYERRQPEFYPEHLEAGTLNAHGIAGLLEGLNYIEKTDVTAIHGKLRGLVARLEAGAGTIHSIRIYGGHGGIDRCGVVALNVGNVPSAEVADILSNEYGICTRAGAHCAPLMHEALGTSDQGAVRMSFGSFNTETEVDAALEALAEIAGRV